jgi:hypothetical protein
MVENIPNRHEAGRQLLSTRIAIKTEEGWDCNEWRIDVGNTGLKLIIREPGQAEQHFLPDNKGCSSPNKVHKFSQLYVLGIYEFCNWWKENKTSLPDSMPDFSSLNGITNSSMNKFRKKLFGNEIYREKIIDNNHYSYQINLDDLAKDVKVMDKLGKIANHARKQNYLMDSNDLVVHL